MIAGRVCDRCWRRENERDGAEVVRPMHRIDWRMSSERGERGTVQEIDLCTRCERAFFKWVNDVPAKGERPNPNGER